jgi:hypothetical protein
MSEIESGVDGREGVVELSSNRVDFIGVWLRGFGIGSRGCT